MLQPTSNLLQNQPSILKAIIQNYTSEDLLKQIASVVIYPTELGNKHTSERSIFTFIKKYLKDVSELSKKYNLVNQKKLNNYTSIIKSIIGVRESSPGLINYDSVDQYVNLTNHLSQSFINDVKTLKAYRIDNVDDFKLIMNQTISIINSYYEIEKISSNMLMGSHLAKEMLEGSKSPFENIKAYRDYIITSYNELSNLKSVTDDNDSNYFILKNQESVKNLSNNLAKFLQSGFNFYNTSYNIFKDNIYGIESSSTHVISAPTNAGKSLFLINLMRDMILNNSFESGDTVIFVTLEDNIPRVMRRFIAIFGNIQPPAVLNLYIRGANKMKELRNNGQDDGIVLQKLENIFYNVLEKIRTTHGVNISLHHSLENSFSTADLSKKIDYMKVVENSNVKCIFFDYIDCALPAIPSGRDMDDYNKHGVIVHELRSIASLSKLPIISATQNSKASESSTRELSNIDIGDSYKKVRYSDYVTMMRMCTDKTILSPEVSRYVLPNGFDANSSQSQQLHLQTVSKILTPMEFKITKSKEGKKNVTVYMLFCVNNLRFYNDILEYMNDVDENKKNTRDLEQSIDDALTNSDSDFGGEFLEDM